MSTSSALTPTPMPTPTLRPNAGRPRPGAARRPGSASSCGRERDTIASGTAPRRRLSCSSPRCSSVGARPRIGSATATATATATALTATATLRPGTPPMSMTTYFGLLKKSQVLEQLLQLSGHASAREEELQRLEREKSRADCVHARVFADLALFQVQLVDAHKCALELVEQLTAVCMVGSRDPGGLHDADASEEQTLRDLQRAVAPASGSSSEPGSSATGGGMSVETQALRAVGRDRVQQLKDMMRDYERQLVGLEGELSRAVHSSAVEDLTARVRELEEREQRRLTDNSELESQLRRSRDQQRALQARLDETQGELATIGAEKRAVDQLLETQRGAIEQFGTALRAELRRRYGTAPSVLDHRWREFFPTIPLPL